MVVAPHAGFAAGDLAARRDVVPAVRPVVDAVQEQALVFSVRRKIRFVEQRVGDGEPGLEVFFSGRLFSVGREVRAQANFELPRADDVAFQVVIMTISRNFSNGGRDGSVGSTITLRTR